MHTRSLKLIVLVIITAFLLEVGKQNNVVRASNLQQDQVLADSGFRPDKDGFGFENYTNEGGPINLTAAELRRMYGDQVCGAMDGDKCILTPPGEAYMNEINNSMNGGHCEGMAVLSLLLSSGKEKIADFGADKTTALPFSKNDTLTRAIAYYWATQVNSPTNDAYIYGTPNEIVDKLIAGLKDGSDQYVLAVRNPDQGGHAITPYAVIDKGNNIVWIMVYDNNIPNTERHVEVNRQDNTWMYSLSTNPEIKEAVWTGNAESQTMLLKPMAPRFQQQVCPFCEQKSSRAPGLAAPAQSYNQITLTSGSKDNLVDLLITDDQGHKLGYQGGKLLKEIPGASADLVDSADLWQDKPEPVYQIPVGVKFTITVDGTNAKTEETANIYLIGPDHDLYIDNIRVSPGEKDTIVFSPDGSTITYTPSSDETPDLGLGFSAQGADYGFIIYGAEVEKGQSVNLALDLANGHLNANTTNTSLKATFDVYVERVEGSAEHTFTKSNLTVDPGTTATIEYGKWTGTGDVVINVGASK